MPPEQYLFALQVGIRVFQPVSQRLCGVKDLHFFIHRKEMRCVAQKPDVPFKCRILLGMNCAYAFVHFHYIDVAHVLYINQNGYILNPLGGNEKAEM